MSEYIYIQNMQALGLKIKKKFYSGQDCFYRERTLWNQYIWYNNINLKKKKFMF